MKDVASVMGVSVMTVSNAFSRPDQLSADLRDRILSRATKMGYSGPDATARHLRSGRTNTFAVIFKERLSYAFRDPFSVLWLAAFCEVMEQQRASVLLLSVPAGDDEARTAIQNTSADGVAGLCPDQIGMQQARERGLPSVVCSLGHRLGHPADTGDHVVIDDYAAGFDLASHVRRLGHQRVDVFVESFLPDGRTGTRSLEQLTQLLADGPGIDYLDTWPRLLGILDGLSDADVRIVLAGQHHREVSRESAALVLDRHDRPTAVIAISDVMALGFMDACSDRGITPGADISVAGFDDLPGAEAAGLTTIAQPIADKGRLAAELLLDPRRTPRQIVLPHRLVVRASTQPAPVP